MIFKSAMGRLLAVLALFFVLMPGAAQADYTATYGSLSATGTFNPANYDTTVCSNLAAAFPTDTRSMFPQSLYYPGSPYGTQAPSAVDILAAGVTASSRGDALKDGNGNVLGDVTGPACILGGPYLAGGANMRFAAMVSQSVTCTAPQVKSADGSSCIDVCTTPYYGGPLIHAGSQVPGRICFAGGITTGTDTVSHPACWHYVGAPTDSGYDSIGFYQDYSVTVKTNDTCSPTGATDCAGNGCSTLVDPATKNSSSGGSTTTTTGTTIQGTMANTTFCQINPYDPACITYNASTCTLTGTNVPQNVPLLGTGQVASHCTVQDSSLTAIQQATQDAQATSASTYNAQVAVSSCLSTAGRTYDGPMDAGRGANVTANSALSACLPISQTAGPLPGAGLGGGHYSCWYGRQVSGGTYTYVGTGSPCQPSDVTATGNSGSSSSSTTTTGSGSTTGSGTTGTGTTGTTTTGTGTTGTGTSTGTGAGTGTTTGTTTTTGTGTGASDLLGADPGISNPDISGIADVSGGLKGLLPGLRNYQLPSHSESCPTATITVFNKDIVFDSHCTLADKIRPILSASMAVTWAVIALMILLSA